MKSFKYFVIFSLVILANFIISCENSKSIDPNSVTLKVESELGELGNFMMPSDEEVVVKLIDEIEDGDSIKSIVSTLALNVSKSVASNYGFVIKVDVLDENHIKICDLPRFYIESNRDRDNGDLDRILSAGIIRAQMKESGKTANWDESNQEMWEKIRTQGKYIVLKSRYSNAKYAEYNGNSSSDNEYDCSSDDSYGSSSSSGSEDWDALLDSYESYVTKYISYVKKAAEGDTNALSEYPALINRAQEFSNKMKNAQGVMSASQWSRYIEITNKMTQAAASMH